MKIGELINDLKRDEGVKSKPYHDSVGKLTIGVGRNLDDVGLYPDEIEYLLANDIRRVMADLDHFLPWWRDLSDNRQKAIANMAFNLGTDGLLRFKHTLELMKAGSYSEAAKEAMNSVWAKQVPFRAQRVCDNIKNG